MFKNNARKTLVLVKYCAIIAVFVFIRCFSSIVTLSTIRYNRKEEFNVDLEAECDQLNVAHLVRKK